MQDSFVAAESITASVGPITAASGNIVATSGNVSAPAGTVSGATGSISGTLVVATLNSSLQYGGASATTGVALTTAGTISIANRVSKVTPGSAVTAVIMAKGSLESQELTIMNLGAAAGS